MRPNLISPAGPCQQMSRVACMARLAVFAVAVAIFSPLPSNAYSTYSLITIGSDGSITGCAVTDGTPPPGTNYDSHRLRHGQAHQPQRSKGDR
jgi:hypothetical protein